MNRHSNAFPIDLGITGRAGLIRADGAVGPWPNSPAETETHNRQEQLRRDLAARHSEQRTASGRSERFGHEVLSRWTTWLPSVPLMHRSSPAAQSSSACGS